MAKDKNDPAPIVEKKSVRNVVIAKIAFSDALTGKNFRAGDEVDGWLQDRVEEYSKRGLVYQTAFVGPAEVK